MKKLILFALLALSSLMASAQNPAVGSDWVDVSKLFEPSEVYGKIYYYTRTEVAVEGVNYNVVLPFQKLDEDQVRLMLAAQRRLPPSTVPVTMHGPFRFKFNNPAKPGTWYPVRGNTVGEIRESMAMCPSDICTSPYVSSSFGDIFYETAPGFDTRALSLGGYFRNMALVSTSVAPVFVRPPGSNSTSHYLRMQMSASGHTGYVYLLPSDVTCPNGYTRNINSAECDLTDIVAASVSIGDGVCTIFGGLPVFGDPDCDALYAAKKLTTSVTADGEPAVSVATKSNAVVTQVYNPKTQGSTVSTVSAGSGGATVRKDVAVSSNGSVGGTVTTNYPANPPPLYPGDVGGTPIPGTGSGGTNTSVTAPTLGPQMNDLVTTGKAGNVELGKINDTLNKINDSLTGKPGAPGGGEGEAPAEDGVGEGIPEEVTTKLDSFSESASVPVMGACPANMFSFTLPLPRHLGGNYFLSDRGLICNTLGEYQDLIRMVSIACGFIAASFIVLRS